MYTPANKRGTDKAHKCDLFESFKEMNDAIWKTGEK